MKVIALVSAVAILMLGVGIGPVHAQQQQKPSTTNTVDHALKLTLWPTSVTATNAGAANWTTTLLVFNYRFIQLESPWGFQLQYGTGGQGGWGGTSSTALRGTDTIWSTDVTYRWVMDQYVLHGFAGYGSLQWETVLPGGTNRYTSSGLRVGADALVPLGQIATDGSYWAINAIAAWYPANTTSFVSGGTTTTGSGSSTDVTVSVRYKLARPASAKGPDIGYQPTAVLPSSLFDGTSWALELGYRWISGSGWSGAFLTVGKTF